MPLHSDDVEMPPFNTPAQPAMIALRNGDRVLIAMAEDPTPDEAHAYMDGLHKAFPGVEFVVLGNVAGVAVMPGPAKRTRRTEQ